LIKMVKLIKKWSISSQIISDTAKEMWYDVEVINESKNLFIVKNKDKEVLFKSTDCGINSSLALKLCDDKELTYNILWKNLIRIAESIYLNKNNLADFHIEKSNLNFPLVVKPLDLWHWDGVYTEIKDENELNIAIENCLKFSDNIIVQEHIYGDEHRILVIWNEVVFGARRINAHVIGNEKNTIKELIEKENTSSLRWDGYDKPMSLIKIDNKLINYIRKYYDYTIDSIPEEWEEIVLRGVSNVWAGGTIQNVTDELWIEFKEECIKIAKILWLDIAWIDIITSDLSKPLSKSKWIVLEVWATPWFGGYKETTGINPARHLLNFVFRKWD